jgi:parvulin-like peptidyl-prolyl isomerase
VSHVRFDHVVCRGTFVAIAIAALFLCGCKRKAATVNALDTDVLAVVGTREIRAADLERELASRGPAARPEAVLEEMIRFEARLSEARRTGIDAEPETQRAIERMLVSRLEERQRGAGQPSVTDAEVTALYESEIDRHTLPAAVRGGVLRIGVSTKADESSRRRKGELAAELRSRAESLDEPGYHALVRESSDDTATRYNRGDTGWITATDDGSLPVAVAEALRSLRTNGAISPVIETTNAFLFVRLYATRPRTRRPLQEIADGLRHRILLGKSEERDREHLRRILGSVPIRTNSAALAGLSSRHATHPSNPSPPRNPTP